MDIDPLIVYFSSATGNTDRFVKMLGVRSKRIPIFIDEELTPPEEPFVLISPTYANDDGSNAVPKQVIRFLNNPVNREHICGVIGAGNRNFGEYFAHAGKVISKKCNVPLLYKFELSGTPRDVKTVREGIMKLWQSMRKENAKKVVTTILKTGS